MGWKKNFEEGKELVLSTSSKGGKPNANLVVSLGFVDDGLLVADCQMNQTIKNLLENPWICVVGGYYRVQGTVKISTSGKLFDICVEKSKGYKVKHAILVEIKEVFDLDKGKIIPLGND
jgi:hypothetical protein